MENMEKQMIGEVELYKLRENPENPREISEEKFGMLGQALGDENPPLGIAMVMEGTHLCKTMRGARKNGKMVSSCLTGIFKEDMATRNEFLNIVRNER